MELCVLCESWPVLLNARHCRDTKGCCSLLWYFHSSINTGLVFPSGVSSPSVRHPLPLSCQRRCQTGTAAGLSPSRRAVWCPRNPASSPAPGRCLRGKDASAATRALLLLCVRGSAAVSAHVFVKDFPRLHVCPIQERAVCFLDSPSLYGRLPCCPE